MVLDEILDYKLKLRLYLNSLGVIASLLFGTLQFVRGDFGTALISYLGSVYFIIIVYTLLRRKHYLWKGRGFIFFIPATILNVIHVHPEFGIFWAYVAILSFFLVMEFKEACVCTTVFTVLALYLVSPHYPADILFRIYGTLILVALFAFCFSLLIERLHKKVNTIATHDPLTQTLNRYTFYDSIEASLYEFNRYKNPATLVLIDLDFFKEINDDFGHLKGDRVLTEIAILMKKRVRDCDRIFRYGGEEFAILLPYTRLTDALTLAEQLRNSVETYQFCIPRRVSISIGLSELKPNDCANSWIERCDQALYRAKSEGRNRTQTG